MAVLKFKDIVRMQKQEKEEKLKELKLELIKKNTAANKAGKIKAKEIKKAIARILTCQKFEEISEHAQKLEKQESKKFLTSLQEKNQTQK